MKGIIVEDMPQVIAALEADLAAFCPQVTIVGSATSVVSAAKLIQQVKPDIIFLDIMLGDGTGFDLLEIFPKLEARIIFTTASEEYALRAFRYAAVDYLLKPIAPEQLAEAVERAVRQLGSNRESLNVLREAIAQPELLPTRLSLHTQERIIITEIDQIVRCEADGNNTRFVLASGEKIYVTKTLKQFDQLLERHRFMRVHQTHLVNFRFVKGFEKKDGGFLLLKNGETIPVSVRKKMDVMQWLEGF